MKWQKIRERLPCDGQEVLLRDRSIVQLAIFNEELGIFQLKDGSTIPAATENLLWLELERV